MNKKAWQDGMERIKNNVKTSKANLVIAEKNVVIVREQVEESKFILEAYRAKIKSFK